MSEGSQTVIEAKQLGRRFGNSWAVRSIELQIDRGQIFGLVGPDGAGKTTLLQLLSAILDPSEGQCRVLGFDIARQASEITSRIGYMAQGFTLYERLSVAENLQFAARVRGVALADLESRRQRLLAMAGLAQFVDRREAALSGGMRKKLALCTNLIHEPALLLLDEPGLGVDPLSRRELWYMLEEYRKAGATIVLATSYMDEAERCDRLAFLDKGSMLAVGPPGELRARAEGSVFRMKAREPAEVEELLARTPGVLGMQWRPGEVRFVVEPGRGVSDGLRQRVESAAQVEPAAPSMEDVFVMLSKGGHSARTGSLPTVHRLAVRKEPSKSGFSIQTRGITRRFGSFTAVDRVSLDMAAGEVFGLLGANGAGKTTLIRMLCGLMPPTSGTAEVAGIDAVSEPRRLRQYIGYMSQRFSLYADMSVTENLDFFASAYGLGWREARGAITWARSVTGLEDIGDEIVRRLSGGVRQRVALACSLLHRPAVLFLDEPTSGVDPLARFRFWRLIGALAAAGTSVLVTTHYLEEAAYCRRLGFMHEGRLIAAGSLAELRAGLPGQPPESAEGVFLAYLERQSAQTQRAAENVV